MGAVMGELLKGAIATINKGRDFGPTLESNIETLNSLAPQVEEMKRYNKMLDRPIEEIARLESQMQAGEELVRKCSKFGRWRMLSFPYYQSKLKSNDANLKRHFSVNVPAENKRDLMEVVASVRQILEILSKKEDFRHSFHLRGLSGAPQEPECVGMDVPLSKLRIDLLKDGVSVLVLTGLGGSGKSTLAKKICWDPQVKGNSLPSLLIHPHKTLFELVDYMALNCGHGCCGEPENLYTAADAAIFVVAVWLHRFKIP